MRFATRPHSPSSTLASGRQNLRNRSSAWLALMGAVALAGITACSSPEPSAGQAADSEEGAVHGYVEGASENPEPQLQLAVVGEDGDVHLHDLLDGETRQLGRAVSSGAVDAVTTDGRLLAVTSGTTTTLVDSGTWTVDHGDHSHYYRAEARILEGIENGGPARIASSETMTTLFTAATGSTVILDRNALAAGEVAEVGALTSAPHDGVALPVAKNIVATVAGEAGTADRVAVFAADGSDLGHSIACPDARGGSLTRVGAVVGCANGAVLATESADGSVALEAIPYPEPIDTDTRAVEFAQRPGRPSVAAVAGTQGLWVLDTRARAWQLIPTETPLVTAVAADDERDLVVALDTEGRVLVVEPESGERWMTESLVTDPARARLDVDADRAYLGDPASTAVFEIDYADRARVARTLQMPVRARFFAETGR